MDFAVTTLPPLRPQAPATRVLLSHPVSAETLAHHLDDLKHGRVDPSPTLSEDP